ncbi:hypothetical protein LPJ61_004322 [Coemansia biformis]|uniref:Uncharacterized protein n=1 Tax=Coemansia biformis TaxID=1286918 RepID=A0A9W7Y9R2_9FUNG|nr:hypothetical protein LPJ61_004322 [Coemansia biformis]
MSIGTVTIASYTTEVQFEIDIPVNGTAMQLMEVASATLGLTASHRLYYLCNSIAYCYVDPATDLGTIKDHWIGNCYFLFMTDAEYQRQLASATISFGRKIFMSPSSFM